MAVLRFLIVENHEAEVTSLERVVTGIGHEVAAVATSCAEAVSEAERVRPHVVLMDVRQEDPPDVIRASERLSEEFGSETLFLASSEDDPTFRELRYTQPLSCLTLPVDPTLLKAACQIALFRRMTEGALERACAEAGKELLPATAPKVMEDAEAALEARAHQQTVVSQLGQLALAGVNLATLLAEAAEAVAQTLGVEFCKVLEYRPEKKELLLRTGVGWKKGLIGEATIDVTDDSLEAYVLRADEPVIVEDFGAEKRFEPSVLLRGHGAVSALCVVIRCITGPYGVLSAHSTSPRSFTSEDIRFLDSVANLLALAIEQRRAEEALREGQRRYELAVAGAGEGLWEWRPGDADVLVSTEGKTLLGLEATPSRYSVEQCGQLVHPDDRARVEEALAQHLEEGAPYFDVEFRTARKEEGYRWLYTRGIAIRDREGEVLRVCGTFRDMTPRRERFEQEIAGPLRSIAEELGEEPAPTAPFSPEDELSVVGAYIRSLTREMRETRTSLAERQSQLQMAEKLASVGRLAASVAHEIRNPLTSLRMRLYSLEASFGSDPDSEEDFLVISEEVSRLEAIVQNFLEFARPRDLHLRETDIRALIEKSLGVLRPQLEERAIRLVREEAPGIPAVRVDPDQVEQVFINLVANAIDALEDGGKISIAIRLKESRPGDREVRVLFSDNGPGIPEDVRPRLFDPFFTTKDNGTGLGLCISSQIAERHGGRLWIEDTGPRGTTFALSFPVR